ncbi:type VII secretion protein EccCb [Nocardia sp. NPDC058518]|uniref:type VII secretion protein EccCb n=1 Tax=Nocardia sp. NPDC058518 TaxID=3346534 RepID=UPI00364EC65C
MSSPTGRRIALFVANDTYHFDGLSRLYAPISDAEQLRELLRDPEIGGFRPTELLINESKAEIERSIERVFRGAEPDDVILFYFSGHGLRTRQNLYLAVGNTDPQLLSSTAVSASFIRELIRESAAAAKIIVLDCCYSGAFLGSEVIKSAPTIDDVAQQLAAGDGICVLTASSAVETAAEGRAESGSAPLSVFTSALVRGIGTGQADNGSGLIGTHDLWTFAHADVRSRTTRQTPNHYGVFKDEVYIARVRRRQSSLIEVGDRVQLGSLVGRLEQTPDSGLWAANWWGTGRLKVPIGQERRTDGVPGETVWLDLAGADRNLFIVGRAGSGKSTLLRTLTGSLALTHSPDEVKLYVLESSNRLGSMSALPHIASVVGDDELEKVGVVLDRVAAEIGNRKRLYRETGIDSPGSLRAARSSLARPVPDVFLFIDRLGDFREQIPGFDGRIKQIASAGPEYGVHLVVTARDWNEAPDDLVDLLSAHIELHLHRPADSRLHPERAARLPDGPGWALFGERPFRIAMPDLRELQPELLSAVEISDGAAELVDLVRGNQYEVALAGPGRSPLEGEVDFAELIGIGSGQEFDINEMWRARHGRDRLRVPIGVTATGDIVELDLKESAENGMGPHGLCIGATGSGKSEFLRSLILSLVATHSPDALNLVLVDFKGGATFFGLESLPHVSAVIANVEEDLSLIDRTKHVLSGEMNRRQEILRTEGRFANVHDYEKARAAGAPLDPLPALLIVVDEYSELLAQKPDFIDLFIMIGRLGRSLHVHQLLASHRYEENKLRGLESHLSYRIGLRTFSAAESRAVLGTPDAYHLPSDPGSGYLRTDASDPVRFKSAYVSRSERVAPGASHGSFEQRTLLEAVVSRIQGHGRSAHPLWLPPLGPSPTLNSLLPEQDWRSTDNPPGQLSMPIGIIDNPFQQRRDVLTIDLVAAKGHVAVVGGPLAGKSTTLQTIVLAAAVTHNPEQLQFYCLDFGGGLAALERVPHVGSVAGRMDGDRVRRTITELTALLRRREQWFAELGVDSMSEYRRRKSVVSEGADSRNSLPPDRFGDVVLVIDGWRVIGDEFEILEPQINAIATQGLSYGIHLMISASRWTEIRPMVRDQVGTRIELRLGHPADSEINHRVAQQVPEGRPGRGITADHLHMLIALPRLDSDADPATLTKGLGAAVAELDAVYGERRAPEVRMLPLEFSRESLLAVAAEHGISQGPTKAVVGLCESELQPLVLDFATEPHFMAFADTECGKTTLLRNIVFGIVENASPSEARIVLIDYRRTMLDTIEGEHLAGYSTSSQTLVPTVAELAAYLAQRIPSPDITAQQLRDRSWWSGPEIYLVVDDYDLVAPGSAANPFVPLVEFFPQARDVGMHFIVARRTGGVSRALYDPVLGALKNLSVETLVMSGPRDEGKIAGDVRPMKLPPGRGILVSRTRGQEMVQIADMPEPQ